MLFRPRILSVSSLGAAVQYASQTATPSYCPPGPALGYIAATAPPPQFHTACPTCSHLHLGSCMFSCKASNCPCQSQILTVSTLPRVRSMLMMSPRATWQGERWLIGWSGKRRSSYKDVAAMSRDMWEQMKTLLLVSQLHLAAGFSSTAIKGP